MASTPDAVVQWSPSAPVHAAEADITDWTDLVGGIRDLDYSRGYERRPGRVEAGELTLVMGDPTRALDTTNPDSPHAGVWAARRPLRVRLTSGATTKSTWRGFVTDILPDWHLRDMWSTIKGVDNLALLAEPVPYGSVIGIEIAALAPPIWYPMNEGGGSIMHDPLHPLAPGTYVGPTFDDVVLAPYASGFGVSFSGQDIFSGSMAYGRGATRTWGSSFHAWGLIKLSRAEAGAFGASIVWSWYDTVGDVYVDVRVTATGQIQAIYGSTWGSSSQRISRASGPVVDTNQPYVVELRFTPGAQIRLYVNGVLYTGTTITVSPDPTFGNLSGLTPVGGLTSPVRMTMGGGWSLSGFPGSMGHVFAMDRVLTAAEQAALIAAVRTPWEGDTTGERAHKMLDAMGVADVDRAIDDGTEFMGAEAMAAHGIEVFNRIATTEGGMFFVDGDGRFTLHARNHRGVFRCVYDTLPEPTTTNSALTTFEIVHDDRTYFTEATCQVAAPEPIDVTYRHPNADSHGSIAFSDPTAFATPEDAMERAVQIVGAALPRNEIVSAETRYGAEGVDGAVLIAEDVGDEIDVMGHPPDGTDPALVPGLWGSTFVWGGSAGWAGPKNPIRQRVRTLKVGHHLDGRGLTFDVTRSTQEVRA